ncbi:hypothetical protein ABZ942_29865 [Nocardia sp. NPDC046473]|uniref:hypothetical protein n=1 Tax=Nocardia sp. NPDC046473 TaxID=3155733 RepID=UPI0033E2507F
MEGIAVEINREEQRSVVVAGGRKRSRAGVLLVAGLLGASALGYGVLAAPGSMAADTNTVTCKGKGKVEVAKDGADYSITAEMADVEVSGEGDACKKPGSTDPFKATTKTIAVKETDSGCVITGTANAPKDQSQSDTDAKFTLTIPKDGKPATLKVSGKVYPNSAVDADDKFEGSGTVKGIKLETCDKTKIPVGTFTATGSADVTTPQ